LYILNILVPQGKIRDIVKVGDVILEMCGKVVTSMNDLSIVESQKEVDMTVLRDGKEVQLKVPTNVLSGQETTQVLRWAGAMIQLPYHAVLAQAQQIPSGVYVSCSLYGSPANTHDLRPGVWINKVNGIIIKSRIDHFLEVVQDIQNEMKESGSEAYLRLEVVSRNGSIKVLSLKPDPHYWPTWMLQQDSDNIFGWTCKEDL